MVPVDMGSDCYQRSGCDFLDHFINIADPKPGVDDQTPGRATDKSEFLQGDRTR